MRRGDSVFLIPDKRNDSNVFKMTKTKTALVLVMIIFSCGLIFSITDAYPTRETSDGDTKLSNNSSLVITHVVKTIEFEVGVLEDDGVSDENATDSNVSEFYETDIHLLNAELLKQLVNQVNDDENREETMKSKQTSQETEQTEQVQDKSLFQFNQTTS